MRNYFVTACFAVGLAELLGGQAMGTPPRMPQCIEYKLEPIDVPSKSGPVEMLLSFKMKPGYECDSVMINIMPTKRIFYDGPDKFFAHLSKGSEYSTKLTVGIAPNDTSAILIMLSCKGCAQDVVKTFITTGDTVRVLDYLPTPVGPEPPHEQRSIKGLFTDTLHPPKEIDLRRGPDSASMWQEPTEEEIRLKTREARVRQMQEMEKQPLTHLEAQIFTIDSVDYIRRRGETKFHVAVPVKDTREFARHLADSVAALPPETEYDVVFHLPEAEMLKLARELTDSLVPANRADFYLTRTTRAVIKRLCDAGAGVGYLDQMPVGTFTPATDTSESDEVDTADATPARDKEIQPSSGGTLLLNEGFDRIWPGNWNGPVAHCLGPVEKVT